MTMNMQERQARNLAIVRDLREGMRRTDVARKYGLARETVSLIFSMQSVDIPIKRKERDQAIV